MVVSVPLFGPSLPRDMVTFPLFNSLSCHLLWAVEAQVVAVVGQGADLGVAPVVADADDRHLWLVMWCVRFFVGGWIVQVNDCW